MSSDEHPYDSMAKSLALSVERQWLRGLTEAQRAALGEHSLTAYRELVTLACVDSYDRAARDLEQAANDADAHEEAGEVGDQ